MKLFYFLILGLFLLPNIVLPQSGAEIVRKTGYTTEECFHLKLSDGRILTACQEKVSYHSSVSEWRPQKTFYISDSLLENQKKLILKYQSQWQHPNTITTATQLTDGTIFMGGGDDPSCLWCGTGYHSFNTLSALSILTDTIVQDQLNNFNFTPQNLGMQMFDILQLESSNLLCVSDKYLSFLSPSGDSLITIENYSNYMAAFNANDTSLIMLNDTGAYLTDHSFSVQNSYSIIPPLVFHQQPSEELILGDTLGEVVVLDNSLNLLHSANLTSSFTALNDINSYDGKMYFFGEQSGSYKLLRTDQSLNRIDSTEFSTFNNVSFKEVIPYDNYFIVVGMETVNEKQQPVLKKYNYGSNADYTFQLDAGVVDYYLEYVSSSPTYPNAPSSAVDITYKVFTTVENYGNKKIDTLQVTLELENHYSSLSPVPCYNPIVYKSFTDLGLEPNDQMEVYLGEVTLFSVVDTGTVLSSCAWTDQPNYKIDHDFSNNKSCEQINTDVAERELKSQISIYPTLLKEDELFIDFQDLPTHSATVEIRAVNGKLVHTEAINSQRSAIGLSLPAGVYFVTVFSDQGNFSEKLVVVK